MTKFQVGDELIRTAHSSSYYTKGKTYEITYHSGNQCSVPDDTGSNHLWTEDYLKQRFVLKSEYRPTKNQRITALEKRVTELERLLTENGAHYDPRASAPSVDELIRLGNSVDELTNNQKRKAIIEKAKKFVEVMIQQNFTFRFEFVVKASKNTVVVLVRGSGHNHIWLKAIAKCHPDDVFNEHIGKAIALGRALGLDVSEFEQAVQPDEVVVGMRVEYQGYDVEIKSNKTLCNFRHGTAQVKSIVAENSRITNDTDAVY